MKTISTRSKPSNSPFHWMPILLLILALPFAISGQDSPSDQPSPFNIRGFVQSGISIADNPNKLSINSQNLFGFGIPYLRLTPFGSIGQRTKWSITLSYDHLEANILDAYIDQELSTNLSLRFGLFPVPGAISGEWTPIESLECNERPMVTQLWSQNAQLRSDRNLGLQLSGNIMKEKARYYIMFANPIGQIPPRAQLTQPLNSELEKGLNFWGRIEARPIESLDIGAFYSNNLIGELDLENNSYGANLYFNLDHLFVKMEYIAGEYGQPDALTEWRGFWLSIGYQLNRLLPIFRYDSHTPNVNGSDGYQVNRYDNITMGLIYQIDDTFKLQADIVFRNELDINGKALKIQNNLFTLGVQYRLGPYRL